MIIVIDKRKRKAYCSRTKSEVAKLLHVHVNTISNWESCRSIEKFNQFTVYFDVTELKKHTTLINFVYLGT